MDDDIRVYPTQIELTLREKPPPTDNSDVWRCVIEKWGVNIYLHNRAKRAILQHAYETPRREVGGALVGGAYVYRDPKQKKPHVFIEITDAVRGNFTRGGSTSLTFTPDTWSQIVSEVEAKLPQGRIVGWYHTHPGHGVFLSELDKFIQNNFFHHSGQLALVVDHINRRAAFFIGSEKVRGGIQQSSEFTWDDSLYRPRTERSQMSGPDISRVRVKDYPATAQKVQAAPAWAISSTDVERSRQQQKPIRRLPGLSWPWSRRRKPQPPMASEQEPVLRIDAADLDSPEVRRVLEEQERARRRAAAYPARYPNMASRPRLLDKLGCMVLAIAVPLLIILIASSLVSTLSPRRGIPLFSGVGVVDPIGVVSFLFLLVLVGLIVLLMLEILSPRGRR